jgi:hypothetical protein
MSCRKLARVLAKIKVHLMHCHFYQHASAQFYSYCWCSKIFITADNDRFVRWLSHYCKALYNYVPNKLAMQQFEAHCLSSYASLVSAHTWDLRRLKGARRVEYASKRSSECEKNASFMFLKLFLISLFSLGRNAADPRIDQVVFVNVSPYYIYF